MGRKSTNLEQLERLLRENKQESSRLQSRIRSLRSHSPASSLGLRPGGALDELHPSTHEEADADTKHVLLPRIERTPTVLGPGLKQYLGQSETPLHPPYESIHSFLGAGSVKRLRQERRSKPHPKTRAIFTIAMIFLLGLLLFRVIT